MSYELKRMGEPCREHGRSYYRLTLEMGAPPSNMGNLFRHTTVPNIPTARRICGVMGITIAQFHSIGGIQVILNEQQRRIMNLCDKLDPLGKSRTEVYMGGLSAKAGDIQWQSGGQKQPRIGVWEFPHAGWAAFFVFYMFFALQLRFSIFLTYLPHW